MVFSARNGGGADRNWTVFLILTIFQAFNLAFFKQNHWYGYHIETTLIDHLQYFFGHIWYQNVRYNWDNGVMSFIYDLWEDKFMLICFKVSHYSSEVSILTSSSYRNMGFHPISLNWRVNDRQMCLAMMF